MSGAARQRLRLTFQELDDGARYVALEHCVKDLAVKGFPDLHVERALVRQLLHDGGFSVMSGEFETEGIEPNLGDLADVYFRFSGVLSLTVAGAGRRIRVDWDGFDRDVSWRIVEPAPLDTASERDLAVAISWALDATVSRMQDLIFERRQATVVGLTANRRFDADGNALADEEPNSTSI